MKKYSNFQNFKNSSISTEFRNFGQAFSSLYVSSQASKPAGSSSQFFKSKLIAETTNCHIGSSRPIQVRRLRELRRVPDINICIFPSNSNPRTHKMHLFSEKRKIDENFRSFTFLSSSFSPGVMSLTRSGGIRINLKTFPSVPLTPASYICDPLNAHAHL